MLHTFLENWQPVLAVAGLGLLWLWETVHPFFRVSGRWRHALRNLSLAGINDVAMLLALSALTAGAAAWTVGRGFGLVHLAGLPFWAGLGISLILLDVWTYFWHRANHRIPLLWRFHRMHHSDEEMDVTTATRFHLGEIAISTVARLVPVLLLGTPPEAILAYDIALVAVTQFHHANIGMGPEFDRRLRYAIVTPNMHRVHHSQERVETDSNYASILSVWDRLFRTYRERADYRTIQYGLAGLLGDRFQTLRGMLATPFHAAVDDGEK